MRITCPACRKANDTGDAVCARCGCDFVPLRAVLTAAEDCLAAATAALQGGRWPAALRHAEQSWALRRSAGAARIAFLAAAVAGQTRLAILWHARAETAAGQD